MSHAYNAANRFIPETDKLTEHLYANVQIANDGDIPIVTEYFGIQQIPLIGHQQDFQVRVVRLKIPMSEVPLFVPKGPYNIGISTIDVNQFTSYDDWVLAGTPVLSSFTTELDLNTTRSVATAGHIAHGSTVETRGMWSERQWVAMMNIALETSWDAAMAANTYFQHVDVLGPLVEEHTPYFNIEDKHIVLYAPVVNLFAAAGPPVGTLLWPGNSDGLPAGPGGGVPQQQFVITMSENLYSFMHGFDAFNRKNYNVVSAPDTVNRVLLFWDDVPSNLRELDAFVTKAVGPWERRPQLHSSIYAFQQASRLIVTTTMSLIREAVLINSAVGEDGVPNKLEVLTDFDIPQGDRPKEFIYYNDQGNDRWMNIKDEGALRRIDLRVYVEFTNGETIPVPVPPGSNANVKLGFRRKKANSWFQISDGERHSK